jgi:cell division protein FtsB
MPLPSWLHPRSWPLPVSSCLLAAAVLWVQGSLWFGADNRPQVKQLRQQLAQQQALNAEAMARNQRAQAELADLREGLEMVEESARWNLGMIKPNEVLVVYTRAGQGLAPAGPGETAAPGRALAPGG